jgi:hypothetical protein
MMELVRNVYGADEYWYDEVCVAERDLERWAGNRRRLQGDLIEQNAVLEKARYFEEQGRSARTQ